MLYRDEHCLLDRLLPRQLRLYPKDDFLIPGEEPTDCHHEDQDLTLTTRCAPVEDLNSAVWRITAGCPPTSPNHRSFLLPPEFILRPFSASSTMLSTIAKYKGISNHDQFVFFPIDTSPCGSDARVATRERGSRREEGYLVGAGLLVHPFFSGR